jgi:hypothetical protein
MVYWPEPWKEDQQWQAERLPYNTEADNGRTAFIVCGYNGRTALTKRGYNRAERRKNHAILRNEPELYRDYALDKCYGFA